MLWNLTRNYNAGLDHKALYLISKKKVHWTKYWDSQITGLTTLVLRPFKVYVRVRKNTQAQGTKEAPKSAEIQIDLQK